MIRIRNGLTCLSKVKKANLKSHKIQSLSLMIYLKKLIFVKTPRLLLMLTNVKVHTPPNFRVCDRRKVSQYAILYISKPKVTFFIWCYIIFSSLNALVEVSLGHFTKHINLILKTSIMSLAIFSITTYLWLV